VGLLHELSALLEQRLLSVEARVMQHPLDLHERKAELPTDQDLLQSQQVAFSIKTIAGLGPPGWDQQPDAVT
jgi:hypothetical protein